MLDLSRTIVVLVGSAIVFANVWDVDLGGLLAALGVGSLVIGLALQDSLGNIFSGIALLFEQPIAIGDWVQIGDVEGEIIEITWRSVHVYTYEKHLVIVPNSEIAQGSLKNFSRPYPIHGISFELGFSCDDPPNKVIKILRKTALETTGVLPDPPPKILLVSYGDFSINYKIRLFVDNYLQGIQSKKEFHQRIWYVIQRYGLTMPYPIEAAAEYVSKAPTAEDLQQKAIQTLQKVPGWESVDRQTICEICQQSTLETYGEGEILMTEKAELRGLFVILEGQVEISTTDRYEQPQIIGILNPIDVFGEKASLLSSQISDFMVIALQDTQVLIIEVETLQSTLQKFPLLSNTLGEMMEFRRQQIQSLSLSL